MVTVTAPSNQDRPWVQRMYAQASLKQLAALLQRDGVLKPPFTLAHAENLGVKLAFHSKKLVPKPQM